MSVLSEDQLRARAAASATGKESQNWQHILSCPECFSATISELFEHSEAECADCGLPLGSQKLAVALKKCPKCGSEEARKIER